MSASGHEHPELGPPRLVEVADRVYAYVQPDGSWYINNTGFIAGRSSVISIDACSTERRTRAYRDAMRTVTDAPLAMLVNTHHHGDHTYGNAVLGADTIIGHERCRTGIIEGGLPANTGLWDPVDWGAIELAPPTVTFSDGLRLWSDDQPVDVTYVGRAAHTDNDCLVWLPEQQVLFCGDLLFNGGTPFLLMGSVTGAIDVLTTTLATIPARVIVPGHGAPCDGTLIATVVGYLEFVLDLAQRAMASGVSPLEAARHTDLGPYAEWLDRERVVGNLHRAYADLGGPDVNLFGAITDMIAYNGGRPLSCYA